MTQTAKEKITKARAGLVLDHPFFGALALRQALREDPTCQTAWTDGQTIGYNPTWIEKLPLDQVKGVLAHEVMHVAAAHHARRQKREPQRWNRAADYAINDLLTQSGLTLPANALTGAGTDQSAEAIYNRLPDDQSGSHGQDPGGCGEVRDVKGPTGQAANDADLTQAEAEAKVAVAQAAAVAKACGKLPGGLTRMVETILEPIIDWRTELRRFLAQAARNDYTWRKPNPRYAAQGLYLPALYSEELPPIVVAIDTSGSIDRVALDQFAAELHALRGEAQASTVSVVCCDSRVQAARTFEAGELLTIDASGGGGTDFRPPFAWVAEQGLTPAAMLYLTDGKCYAFPDAPDYPTLWVITGGGRFRPPFGEVVPL